MIKQLPKIGLSALTVLMLSGCGKLGPDFMGVGNPPIPEKWKHEGSRSDRSIAQWWKTPIGRPMRPTGICLKTQ